MTCCSPTTITRISLRENASRVAPPLPTRRTVTFEASRTCIRPANSPPSATSSPRAPTRTARSRSTSGRSCVRWSTRTIRSSSGGPTWPTPTPPWCSTRTSPEFRCASSASNRASSRARGGTPPTGRTSGPRERCSRSPRRRPPARSTPQAETDPSWCWRICRASTVHPSRCGTSSSRTAPKSAGPSSTSTDRSCSAWSRAITAEPSWCSPTR